MGTVDIALTYFSSNGIIVEDPGYLGYKTYYVGVDNGGGPGTSSSGTVVFSPLGDCMSLDGGARISLVELPIGFTFVSAAALTIKNTSANALGYVAVRVGTAGVGQYARCGMTYGVGPTLNQDSPNGAIAVNYSPVTYGFSDINDTIDLFLPLVVDLGVTDATRFTSLSFDDLHASGAYTIISSSWVFDNLTRPGATNYAPGERVKLHSSPEGSYTQFDQVTSINITNTVITSFDTQTTTEIIFTIPSNTSPSSPVDYLFISGTAFTGMAFVGPITIITLNASGIYEFAGSARVDSIYTNSALDGSTTDYSIPEPYFKTGFIGG